MPQGDSGHRLARLGPAADGRTVPTGELRSGDAAGTSATGLRILGDETHGKNLLTRFSSGSPLHTHLRMQGFWSATPPAALSPARCRRTSASASTTALHSGADLHLVELPPPATSPTTGDTRRGERLGVAGRGQPAPAAHCPIRDYRRYIARAGRPAGARRGTIVRMINQRPGPELVAELRSTGCRI
ncbi:hypothetical protein EV639_102136 [Rathayibacter tanaceti]|uniref:Uncharacterized protein n=2 Tax=Rathayibacter tanaceti TaxID=1671680 RepID=A0A166HZ84_9MICO|nr:hypothetical protein ACH61_01478 [Rathayibacter tanaceti]TCO38493.1 hypothetical protein EV639_102136 [Rathayibacter tanaceti]